MIRGKTHALAVFAVGAVLMAAAPGAAVSGPPACGGLPADIVGTDGDDVLVGTAGDDVIHGLRGDDTVDGGGGNDVVCGGAGRDELTGGPGADVLIGGPGIDYADYRTAPAGVTVDLAAGFAAGGHGDDTLTGIEGVFGSRFPDRLSGDRRPNRLAGFGGRDTLIGKGGDDVLAGQAGPDRLIGGPGDDVLRGGPGRDLVIYSTAPGAVDVFLSATQGYPAGTVLGAAGSDRPDGIENVKGSRHDDTLIGAAGPNRLIGLGGDDLLAGRDGSDVLLGGDGDDLLCGGNGSDDLRGQAGTGDWAGYGGAPGLWPAWFCEETLSRSIPPLTVDLTIGQATGMLPEPDDVWWEDALSGIENVSGSAVKDSLIGDDRPNELHGQEGSDWLDGRGGDDLLVGGAGTDIGDGGNGDDVCLTEWTNRC